MVQILPSDDAFDAGSPGMGSFVGLYLGCVVSTSSVTFWSPNGAFIARPIHGAYQSLTSQGVNDYNAAFHSSGTANRLPSGAVFRRPFVANLNVVTSGLFEMRSVAGGAPGIGDFAPSGVLARVSGGSLAGDGTADVRLANVDGYMGAVYQKSSDSTLRLGIIRWNAGTPTVLVESISIPTATLQWTSPFTVSLFVSGTGATVTLSASLQGFGGTSVLTVNAADTSGSRITVAGRHGFVMGPDRIVSGKSTVSLCHMLAVDEATTRVLQDEFRRLSLAAAKQTTADALGRPGSGYLSSAFYWDAGTYDGSTTVASKVYTGAIKLKHSSGTAVMEHGTADDDVNAGRLLLSQRPASNQFSQRRSVTVTVPTAAAATTGEVWAGIALRASQALPVDENPPTVAINGSGPNFPGNGTANTGGEAYLFVVRARTSTQVTWQLHRIKANGTQLPIANLTENSPFAIFPGYGSSFSMDLDVHPRDAADPFGAVEIACRVNGTLIALALTASALSAGYLSPSTGVYQDPTTNRVPPAFGEGLVAVNGFFRSGSASADIDPIFDTWAQGTLANAAVLDVDQPSVSVAAEPAATGTALDAALQPDWPLEIEYVSHEVSVPFESGHRQTMPRFLEQTTDALLRRCRFKFRRAGVKEAELTALETHWNAHDGTALAFNFTPPGEPTYVVHYTSPIRHTLTHPGLYLVEFELESLSP